MNWFDIGRQLKLVLLLSFGLGMAISSGFAANHPLKALTQRIDSLLNTSTLRPFNGLVHIEQAGKVLYDARHGHADMLTKAPFPKQPQFVIGSLSKQITAVLVLQACAAGQLDLQTPVRQYLPELPMTWADTVTIHQLLNHTSGYQGRDKPLAYAPGAKFSYSNQAYGLLGDILTQVTGQPYETLALALFKRCGMKHSTVPSRLPSKNLVPGFSKSTDGSIQRDTTGMLSNYTPAALLISTPADIARWDVCLHQWGKLIPANYYARMTTGSSRRPHPIFGDVDYGYGVQMTTVDGIHEISHGGYVSGFLSVNFYYPKSKISLVVMENFDWKDPAFKESYWFEMEVRRMLRQSGLV